MPALRVQIPQVYVALLSALVIYVFAVMSLEFITKPQLAKTEEERAENLIYDEIVTTYWGSVPRSMLTLIMFTPWPLSTIFLPMCTSKPHLFFFFLSYMLIVSMNMMNLVTAIIVETSREQSAQDKQVQKLHKASKVEKLMPTFREMFKKLDETGDGTITIQEFVKCPKSIREELCNLFNTDDLVELFELLDFDGSHSIQIEEFCDEMTKLATTQLPIEQIRMLKQM